MSRGQLRRTPENFPRMKHRAAKRRIVYLDISPDVSGFMRAVERFANSMATEYVASMNRLTAAVREAQERVKP